MSLARFVQQCLLMKPKEIGLDKTEVPEEPVENPPLEWAEEDRKIEDRKPDLNEIEEDPSEL